MADPGLLRTAIAQALVPLDIQVSPYVLSSPSPPCAYVSSGPVEYDISFGRGADEWAFTVYVLVGLVEEISAQMTLDRMLMSHGATSVKALLEADRTLGDAAPGGISVPSVTGARIYVIEGVSAPVIGAEWTVVIRADGRS